ncbi:MAG: ribonuclease HIII [Candidatus Aenigmarchaeota archaeon]|nr:ribonuclease HIII [Candidatus Aenigmarchaeota archaeon]
MGRIGIDESGKGDYFGYLVVAGAYADQKNESILKGMGVRDSKLVSDAGCLKLAAKIKKICAHEIVKISPEKYNMLYEKFGNLNRMLAWGHAKVIDNMTKKVGCRDVISDKFSEKNHIEEFLRQMAKKNKALEKIKLAERAHAESDIAVAAASILARAEYLKTLRLLSRTIGYSLPKGSAHVRQAIDDVVRMHGDDILQHVAKTHFNVQIGGKNRGT